MLHRRAADRIRRRTPREGRHLGQHPVEGGAGRLRRHATLRSQAQQVAAFHGMACAADIHVVLAHRAFAEGQVEG